MLDSALMWFRRDLRETDNAALYHALRSARRVWCVFVFDTAILDALDDCADRRVAFIWHSVRELDGRLRRLAGAAGGESGVIVRHGPAVDEIPRLAVELGVGAVLANRDYEPDAVARDEAVAVALAAQGIAFQDFKDQVIFERSEVVAQSGKPFSVFTPYRSAWLKRLEPYYVKPYPVARYAAALAPVPFVHGMPSLAELGFEPGDLDTLPIPTGVSGARARFDAFRERIDDYQVTRDFPAIKGPSYLSVHLRFGTVSIRELAAFAHGRGGEGAATWLSELVWRDFYFMILAHHPHTATRAFRPAFDAVAWDDDEAAFTAWCEGRTGYPLVDAGMRQLNRTGYLHNRLRMVVASFLTKDLGIAWQRGERYFALKLNDFDLAANVGGWQWAASTGCDAQPWFRIFNPVTQSERFDPQGRFIRRYVPELGGCPDARIHAPWRMTALEQQAAGVVIGRDYPAPLVDHAEARERTLARFGVLKTRA